MEPEKIKCRYLLKHKMAPEWRGEESALGKTRPDEYSYLCGHKRRFRRPCKPHQWDDPCPITNSFEWPE